MSMDAGGASDIPGDFGQLFTSRLKNVTVSAYAPAFRAGRNCVQIVGPALPLEAAAHVERSGRPPQPVNRVAQRFPQGPRRPAPVAARLGRGGPRRATYALKHLARGRRRLPAKAARGRDAR